MNEAPGALERSPAYRPVPQSTVYVPTWDPTAFSHVPEIVASAAAAIETVVAEVVDGVVDVETIGAAWLGSTRYAEST